MISFFRNVVNAKLLVGCVVVVTLSLIIYDVSQRYEIDVSVARAVSPTATPAPPTATPVPPTATPAPPTATPVPPTATPAPPTATPMPRYELLQPGGRLTAAAWFDDDHMYIADYEGSIRLLNIRTGETRKVLDGLSIPRGMTILDGRLYISEMGDVCTRMYEYFEGEGNEWRIRSCLLPRIMGMGDYEGYSEVVVNYALLTQARILSYRVHESGNLSDRQTVVDGLISVSHDHAPNGLANDGEYVYASIGHPYELLKPDNLFDANAELFAANGRRPELMGAIARFRPPPPPTVKMKWKWKSSQAASAIPTKSP